MDLEQAIVRSDLICVNVMENHNKFWSAWVLENGDLFVEYGRVGSTAQSKAKWQDKQQEPRDHGCDRQEDS